MNGSEGATYLAYPITHARDNDDSRSLKNDSCFFKKEDLVDASSPKSVIFPYTLNLEFQQTLKFEENVSQESDDK
jgi:hypothetical protein